MCCPGCEIRKIQNLFRICQYTNSCCIYKIQIDFERIHSTLNAVIFRVCFNMILKINFWKTLSYFSFLGGNIYKDAADNLFIVSKVKTFLHFMLNFKYPDLCLCDHKRAESCFLIFKRSLWYLIVSTVLTIVSTVFSFVNTAFFFVNTVFFFVSTMFRIRSHSSKGKGKGSRRLGPKKYGGLY